MKLSQRQIGLIGSFVSERASQTLSERRDARVVREELENDGLSTGSESDAMQDPEYEDRFHEATDAYVQIILDAATASVAKATGADPEEMSMLSDEFVDELRTAIYSAVVGPIKDLFDNLAQDVG